MYLEPPGRQRERRRGGLCGVCLLLLLNLKQLHDGVRPAPGADRLIGWLLLNL